MCGATRPKTWPSPSPRATGSWSPADCASAAGKPPKATSGRVTELEADEVGASLKWATAKVERTQQRGNGDRSSGRERAAERGGDFDEAPPF